MPLCRTCNSESPRVVTHFESHDGQPLAVPRDECSNCSRLAPREGKLELTPYWEAFPNDYDTLEFTDTGERIPCVKDHAKGEFEQRVAEGPVAMSELEQQKEAKRAFARERNQYPMPPEQVQRVVANVREQFEMATRCMDAVEAGIILP